MIGSQLDTTTTTRQLRGKGAPAQRLAWLHVCNGLDPVRDGGMVPSISMTSALSRLPRRIDDQ